MSLAASIAKRVNDTLPKKQSRILSKPTYDALGKWMSDQKEAGNLRILTWGLGVMIAGLVALLSFFGHAIWDHNGRITAIEANRFTAKDGQAMMAQVSELSQRVAKIPTRVPPEWFEKRVDKLEATQEAIQRDLTLLIRAVDQLKTP